MTTNNSTPLPLTAQTIPQRGTLLIQDAFTQTDLRHGLVDAAFLNEWVRTLFSECSEDPDIYGYETGKKWGELYYQFLSGHLAQNPSENLSKPQDYLKDEVTEQINTNFSYMGFGQFRITEGNKFYTIELKNPFILIPELTDGKQMAETLSGFFASLFSLFSGKELECIPVPPEEQADTLRFTISIKSVTEELLSQILQGKTFRDIAEAYNNRHLL